MSAKFAFSMIRLGRPDTDIFAPKNRWRHDNRNISRRNFVLVVIFPVMLLSATGCATINVQGRLPLTISESIGTPHQIFDESIPAVLGVEDVEWKAADVYTWKVMGTEALAPEEITRTQQKNAVFLSEDFARHLRAARLFTNVLRIPPRSGCDIIMKLVITESSIAAKQHVEATPFTVSGNMEGAASLAGTVYLHDISGKEIITFSLRATQASQTFSASGHGAKAGAQLGTQIDRYAQEAVRQFGKQLVEKLASHKAAIIAAIPSSGQNQAVEGPDN